MNRRSSPRFRRSSTSSLGSHRSNDELPSEFNNNDSRPSSSVTAKKRSPSSRKRKNETKSLSRNQQHWSSLKVVELKEELSKRSLKTTGRKADLVLLLEEDDRSRTSGSEPSSTTTTTVDDDHHHHHQTATTNVPATKKPKTLTTTTTTTTAKGTSGSSSPGRKKNTDEPIVAKASPKKKQSPTRKQADAVHQCITDIDVLPKLWNDDMAKENGSYTFKIASWNVAGLRALVRKGPNELTELCQTHDLDMLCLQETKLQDMHLEDPKLKLKGMLDEAGYDEHWSCSTVKKGYSGTCVYVKRRGKEKTNSKRRKQATMDSFFGAKKKDEATTKHETGAAAAAADESIPVSSEILTPTNVTFSVGKEIDNEGRVIVLEFPWVTIANVYVPNAGQKLERLDYRTKEWDHFFLKFMRDTQTKRGLPVIWLGDLNVAHKAYDIWNDGAKHLAKQAGVTEQERESFTEQLEAGFVDVFRRLHPDAKGNYSYWSQRAGNREPNKGLRLDYFVASNDMFREDSKAIPRDSYMIMDQMGSDHAPVVLEIEIKGSNNSK